MVSRKSKILLIINISVVFLLIVATSLYALNVETHRSINEHITKNMFNGFSLNDYIKEQLGMQKGYDEKILNKKVLNWISDGGEYEDKPGWCVPYWRSRNHFHNPMNKSGFSGWWDTGIFSGMSAVNWISQPANTQSCGYYSWNDARDYYYKALTSSDKETREANFADAFIKET
ncbi:MAG: hypothetical protein ABFD82_05700 [Syntrophaceae bacterium]